MLLDTLGTARDLGRLADIAGVLGRHAGAWPTRWSGPATG